MAKTYIREVVSGQPRKVVATLWWDGKKVQAEPESFLKRADKLAPNGRQSKDGIDFLENLTYGFKNGYLAVRNKPDEV